MNLIKSKIEELESLMTNININTELDHSWCEIYKDLIDVLVVKLHRVDKKINNTQKKFIVDILDSFDCATHID